MPQKEEQHLGFISDPAKVDEVKMDFKNAVCFKIILK
jgi:hypothetical protein